MLLIPSKGAPGDRAASSRPAAESNAKATPPTPPQGPSPVRRGRCARRARGYRGPAHPIPRGHLGPVHTSTADTSWMAKQRAMASRPRCSAATGTRVPCPHKTHHSANSQTTRVALYLQLTVTEQLKILYVGVLITLRSPFSQEEVKGRPRHSG